MTPAAPSEAARGVPGGLWDEHGVEVCGGRIPYRRFGEGKPVLILHRDNGMPEREEFFELLAERFAVHVPWLPGFHHGYPEDWRWLANTRDLAVALQAFVVQLELNENELTLVGLGFGGWLATEMATMSPREVARMALVNPMGVRPEHGYICDQFLVNTETYGRQGFADQSIFDEAYGPEPSYEQLEAWETDREMISRLAWKPYMYNQTLPFLLRDLETRTLIVVGEADEIVPPECGEIYQSSLPNARLERLPDCGHAADLEAPSQLAELISAFSTARSS